MTLFFPDNGGPDNNVKISASNSQVGLTVGDTMTITAGDTFTIGAGSTSTIKIGPATSFSLGSAVNISLASTLSYTYGFTASYGAATTAVSTTSTVKATDSYTIQAGVYTPVTQTLILTGKYQVFAVLVGTVISMAAIALAVVGSLSSPMFVAPPSGSPSTASAEINPDSAAVTRSACALAITTTTVFIAQWGLTYLLAKSSAFAPVTSMVFNSTGITASSYTEPSYTANTAAITAKTATVPSVVSTLYAPSTTDIATGAVPTLTHQVNATAIPGAIPLSPQLSAMILTPTTINLNTTTQPTGVLAAATVNTQITMDSTVPQIALYSNSAPASTTGNMTIATNTAINNPAGSITLTSGTGGTSSLTLAQANSATLASGNGSVVAANAAVNIGVAGGGNAVFDAAGVTLGGTTITIGGTNISIGGALTILGSPGPINATLAAIPQQAVTNATVQAKLTADLSAANLEIFALQQQINAAQTEARLATEAVKTLEGQMGQIIKVKAD